MKIEAFSPMSPSHSFPLFFPTFFKNQELLGNSLMGSVGTEYCMIKLIRLSDKSHRQKEVSRYRGKESWLPHFWNCGFDVLFWAKDSRESDWESRREPTSVILNHERNPNRNLKIH